MIFSSPLALTPQTSRDRILRFEEPNQTPKRTGNEHQTSFLRGKSGHRGLFGIKLKVEDELLYWNVR